MSQESQIPEKQNERSITHERSLDDQPFAETMVKVQRNHGKKIMQQVREMATVAFGKGGVTPAEYFTWRLFDERLADADRRAFAGLKAMRRIWKACNFETDWFGLVWDKMALYAMLNGFGLPVPQTMFVYHENRSFGHVPVAKTPEELAALLRRSEDYPLFFKPNGSYQSLGAAAANEFDTERGMLHMADGSTIAPAKFIADVERYKKDGYLAQKRLQPHPLLEQICGDNLSTVRVLVVLEANGPQVLKAAWKLPSTANIADNYWRPGNMMAAVDLRSGQADRLVSGFGLKLQEFDHLPGSTRPINDLRVPDWPKVRDLSLTATTSLGHFRLIGWDIGISDNGPVIVEANSTPDFALHQIAEGRGMLDE